jgi:chromosome segregation ATPase
MATPKREPAEPRDRRRDDEGDGLGKLLRRVLARRPDREDRLERILAEREREILEHASRLQQKVDDLERREERMRDQAASVERVLRRGTSDLKEREEELVELGRELLAREARLREDEAELARRRGELGAVELKRAAFERRERALVTREAELRARESSLEERAAGAPRTPEPAGETPPDRMLLFVPGRTYRLVEVEHVSVSAGAEMELEGERYIVTRIGRSPLPGDRRFCAYLVLGPGGDVSGGSS